MIYEAWKDTMSITFACPETIEAQKKAGLIAKNAELLHLIEAEEWNDAMTQLHERMDWEPYKPLNSRTAEILDVQAMNNCLLYGGPHE